MLLIENIYHLLTVKLLRKNLMNWDAKPFVKSWARQEQEQEQEQADDNRNRKKVKSECSQIQTILWGIFFFSLIILGFFLFFMNEFVNEWSFSVS